MNFSIVRKVWYFLGSIYLAVILITLSAIMVAIGTVIESHTGSHLAAASITYHHPLFLALMAGFFINILVSALRRWPFQTRHIPFLVTHLGLLMVISGVVIKLLWGIQGNLMLMEGTGSEQLLIPHSMALKVQKKGEEASYFSFVEHQKGLLASSNPEYSNLKVKLLGLWPHSEPRIISWVKNGMLTLKGFPPIVPDGESLPIDIFGTTWQIEAVTKPKPLEPLTFQFEILPRTEENKEDKIVIRARNAIDDEIEFQPNDDILYSFGDGYGGYAVRAAEELPFEAMLKPIAELKEPHAKLEDNIPMALFEFQDEHQKERILLYYEKQGSGLQWPVLNGRYLVRFQPYITAIPYHIRLREAKQVNYPGTQQPFSYEADLLIAQNDSDEKETTLSMNQVHETWDGYRFYLANIAPGDKSTVQQVQIVVNKDPAKYWLTYPGAFLVALGIGLLLFWRKLA